MIRVHVSDAMRAHARDREIYRSSALVHVSDVYVRARARDNYACAAGDRPLPDMSTTSLDSISRQFCT